MVGGPTFDASLAALAPFGRLATFGMASRTAPKPVQSGELMSRSRAVVGFWLAHCFTRPEMLQPQMAEMLAMVEAGTLTPVVGGTYPLAEASPGARGPPQPRDAGQARPGLHGVGPA